MFKRKPIVLSPEEMEELKIKDFFDRILPSTVRFFPDAYISGNSYKCVWAIREYPPSTDEQAILSHLADRNNVTLRIYTGLLTAWNSVRLFSMPHENKLMTTTNDVTDSINAENNLQDVIELISNLRRNKSLYFIPLLLLSLKLAVRIN